MTDFYDDYIDSYGGNNGAPPVPPVNANNDRVGSWARNNASPNYPPPTRNGSRSAPVSQYAPSSYGGPGSVRRRGTKRSMSRPVQSTYDDEEEGYGSGEYDEAFEMSVIRIKVCPLLDDTQALHSLRHSYTTGTTSAGWPHLRICPLPSF